MSSFQTQYQLSRALLKNKDNRYSRPIVHLAVAGIVLSLLIMIVAISVTTGYKNVIREKVIGMGSHIRISNNDMNYSFEPVPFDKNQPFIDYLKAQPHIKKLQYFSTKVGIIKTDNQVEGIVLKGIDSTFLWSNFETNIIEGNAIDVSQPEVSKEILISSSMAKKLQLSVGDKCRTYFVQDPPRQRNFTVTGIYETGMPEYDEKFALVDLRQVQKLNDWDSNLVGGIEILIDNYDRIDEMGQLVCDTAQIVNYNIQTCYTEDSIPYLDTVAYQLKSETIKEIYPEIFEWIALFDTNVIVLIIITCIICLITMLSNFFIIILEQIQTIGILKAMGMKTRQVLNLFLFIAGRIIARGLIIGNIVAIALCWAQKALHFIKLDPATYYVSYVPIEFNIPMIIAINVGILVLCILVLAIPSWYIAKHISPVKAIRFD